LGAVGDIAAANESQVLPFVGSINDKRCSSLMDTGALHSFASASFVQPATLSLWHRQQPISMLPFQP
jgi:hypothetical protein